MKIEGIQTRINQNGRIVIPAVIRRGMGLERGDAVVLSLVEGVLRIEPQRSSIRRAGERERAEVPADRPLSEEQGVEAGEMEEWLG
ncbi:MAG: AbrB/MazE/SpoVT family DNA-binding domain-containing protein [Terracidiphilus sp.]